MPSTPAPETIDELVAREFARGPEGVYANHAAIGPWPRCAADAVTRFAQENATQGPAGYRHWIAREQGLREAFGRLLGASGADDIAFVKNTTEGISIVAFGLDWNEGDRVVLPAGEFASNRLPWMAQSGRGVSLVEVDIRAAEDAEQALIDALDERTRVLSVSAVAWNDGFRLDLKRLGGACRERGILFFVDAIQQLGALPLDVKECHIDFLAADAHKWLLGPEGIAVFYSAPEARPRLRLLQRGWHMYDDPWTFSSAGRPPSRTARRFEAGSPNSLGQAALAAVIGMIESATPEVIAARVLANTDRLLGALRDRPDVRLVSRAEPERRSGIVTFRPRSASTASVHRALQRLRVETSVRDEAIRLSPHFYQGSGECGLILGAIDEALQVRDGG